VDSSLFASAEDGGQDTLPSRAEPGAVAAPDFAIDDRRTNRLFAEIVRGVNCRIDQEPKPVHRMIEQMSGQTSIGFARETALRQAFQFLRQAQTAYGHGITREPMATPGPSERIGPVDQPQDRARQAHRPTHGRFQ
jgi:hypothetical protein